MLFINIFCRYNLQTINRLVISSFNRLVYQPIHFMTFNYFSQLIPLAHRHSFLFHSNLDERILLIIFAQLFARFRVLETTLARLRLLFIHLFMFLRHIFHTYYRFSVFESLDILLRTFFRISLFRDTNIVLILQMSCDCVVCSCITPYMLYICSHKKRRKRGTFHRNVPQNISVFT